MSHQIARPTGSAPSSSALVANRKTRLTAYSLAASATAVALTSTAGADVVYSGPQDISIGLGNHQVLDLNLDGIQDLSLKNYHFSGGNYAGATVIYAPGKLVGFSSGLAYVSALSSGALIDASTVGPSFFGSMAYGTHNPNAQFNNVSDAFVGLSFPGGPNLYYGWVRVAVDNSAGTFLIKDWGYENNPGKAITAGSGLPEPTSLSFLAAGASGVALLRRRAKSTQSA